MKERRRLNLEKAPKYTIAVNALQIVGAVTVAAFSVATGGHAFMGLWEQMLLCGMMVVVCFGAALDIRDAFGARALAGEADRLEEAYGQLENLNATLRAQRHDFMNHLQVVYSLLEMEEYHSAEEYIEKVYGDIKRVSRALKTAHPAINALLAAKLADCEGRGIETNLVIESPWNGLTVPGWEICRVLGNLIDNAMDAMKDTPRPRLELTLGESLKGYSFRVANNGPQIPPEKQERIFQRGFSTKGEGRGMGLAIVREIIQQYGGQIELSSEEGRTAFSGYLPGAAPARAQEQGQ